MFKMDTGGRLFGGDKGVTAKELHNGVTAKELHKGVTAKELHNHLPATRSLAQQSPHNKYSSTVSVLIMRSPPKALLIMS
jgi:hypothetical protein